VLTVHRSQGSSFTDVFVAPDVYWPQLEEVRRQLIYVAVSRARRRVWLVGAGASGNTNANAGAQGNAAVNGAEQQLWLDQLQS